MQNRISPLRIVCEGVLDWFGQGPRASRFTPARHTDSRVRFAQYLTRVQPVREGPPVRRTARLLGTSGAVSRGIVRHAPLNDFPGLERGRSFQVIGLPGTVAARRREQAQARPAITPLRTLFHALRTR